MSDEFFIHQSRTYATQYRLTLAERLDKASISNDLWLNISPSDVTFEFPGKNFSGARQTSPEQLPMSFFRQLFPTRLISRMSAKVHGTITWSLREWQMRNSRKSFKQGKSEKINFGGGVL